MAAIYYLDSSALVKRYHDEPGTPYIDAIFAERDATFVISSITIAEVTSALARKHIEGTISSQALHDALSMLAEDLIADFRIPDIERYHIHDAQHIILRHRLRTLDALQLALLRVTKPLSPAFLSSDARLLVAAQAEGVTVRDPSAIP